MVFVDFGALRWFAVVECRVLSVLAVEVGRANSSQQTAEPSVQDECMKMAETYAVAGEGESRRGR